MKWTTISKPEQLNNVKVGTRIRNRDGDEFEVVKVLGMVEGTLQVECKPLPKETRSFAYVGGEWRFV